MAKGQVTVYKLPWGFQAFGVVGGGILVLGGIISIAARQETKEAGAVIGVLVIVLGAVIAGNALTTSVTIHEQGVVIREKLRRRFYPWQAVLDVHCRRNLGERTWIVYLHVDTGVKYMDRHEHVEATRGTEQHTRAIVEEMEEFRRREQAARPGGAGPS